MNPIPPRCWPAAMLLALAIACFPAPAATLQVAPTLLPLPADQQAGALWLSNSGTQPVNAQVRVYRWTQQEGEDRLEPTTDLVASPPMLTLAAGERRLIRVVRTSPLPQQETAYRVLVDELPGPAAENDRGLRFLLRYSIPVFVAAGTEAAAPYRLSGRVLAEPGGRRVLQLENRGGGYAQIADLALTDSAGRETMLLPGLVGYVLPGRTMRWPLPADAPSTTSGELRARVNSEPEKQMLALDPDSR